MSLFQDILNKVLTGGIGFRDYRHGSKIFGESNYRLMPKPAFLFHVFIEINPAAASAAGTFVRPTGNAITELSLMTKSVDLPKFTVENKVLNAYNRPNFLQSKIKYDPVTIVYHDDSADIVRSFWYDYYSYYYRDSDHDEAIYPASTKYSTRTTQSWGYSPLKELNYLNAIRIFSFHQQRFSEYKLLNPFITGWQHGKHNQSETTGLLDHTMTIMYESIQYAEGTVAAGAVPGFGELHYDSTFSPLKVNRVTSLVNDVTNLFKSPPKNNNLSQTKNNQIASSNTSRSAFSVNESTTVGTNALNTSTSLSGVQVSQYKVSVPTGIASENIIKASQTSIPVKTRNL